MYFQLAWRNIWRNPRRTTVIFIAIVMGIWIMISMAALMRGVADGMVRQAIKTLTGEIQIHHQGYRNDPVVENSITDPSELKPILDQLLPQNAKWTARVRVNAIASNARHSSGVTLVGIDPLSEEQVSFIGKKAIIEGKFLDSQDTHGIILGKALVEKFETRLGNKIVMMTQNTQKEIASRAFRIVGIFKADMADTEKNFVFINLPEAQKMLQLDRGISEIALILPKGHAISDMATQIKSRLSSSYEVHTWRELLHALSAYLKMFDKSMQLWYMAVFIAMGFGIVNTMLMAVFERIREFGLLKALGMKSVSILWQVLCESCLILVMGMGLGNFLSVLTVYVFNQKGIDLAFLAKGAEFVGMSRIIYPNIGWDDLLIVNLTVWGLGMVISLYPALKAARFSPVKAMSYY
ncbi:MAG: ABC transporter permease [Desulfobacterales bacterium]|nr:ABC transporter permease [Desulfobacterales bacterium]